MSRATRRELKRYQWFGRMDAFWFRSLGLIEIVLSVSFPFVVNVLPSTADMIGPAAVQQELFNTQVITGISVLIAIVASMSAFYTWRQSWQLTRNQALGITRVLRFWELSLLRLTSDPQGNEEEAFKATEQALELISQALEHEHDVFFDTVRMPNEVMTQGKRSDLKAGKEVKSLP